MHARTKFRVCFTYVWLMYACMYACACTEAGFVTYLPRTYFTLHCTTSPVHAVRLACTPTWHNTAQHLHGTLYHMISSRLKSNMVIISCDTLYTRTAGLNYQASHTCGALRRLAHVLKHHTDRLPLTETKQQFNHRFSKRPRK